MILTTFEQWRQWAHLYSVLPYVSKVSLEEDRVTSWERAWAQTGKSSFVLESGKGGRYTFMGLSPVSILKGTGKEATTELPDGQVVERHQGEPLELVKSWMKPYRSPIVKDAPKFIGGCVGYLAYDVARSLEKLPNLVKADSGTPDYIWMRFEEIWIIDHLEKALYCAVHLPVSTIQAPQSDSRHVSRNDSPQGSDPVSRTHSGSTPVPIAESDLNLLYESELSHLYESELSHLYESAQVRETRMRKQWADINYRGNNDKAEERQQFIVSIKDSNSFQMNVEQLRAMGIMPAFEKSNYVQAVKAIQAYISAGDVFQVNLSVRQSRPLHTAPEEIYEWLRLLNPSPYMGLLRFPEFQLVSASPELLVQLEGNLMRTRPIAGTRPRGDSHVEDSRLAKELLENEKERAEHVMLVDLQRNDLGKVAKMGTVRVDEFMVIEYYSHVMHIVSEVRGELATGLDAFDVIRATFPGGTITGAPKIRTMEIIEELEPERRGPYTGSLGWIDFNGNMELNIIIRTLLSQDGMGHVQAGAGIVIDSDSEKEYIESLNKAKALWKAVQLSEMMLSGKV